MLSNQKYSDQDFKLAGKVISALDKSVHAEESDISMVMQFLDVMFSIPDVLSKGLQLLAILTHFENLVAQLLTQESHSRF